MKSTLGEGVCFRRGLFLAVPTKNPKKIEGEYQLGHGPRALGGKPHTLTGFLSP